MVTANNEVQGDTLLGLPVLGFAANNEAERTELLIKLLPALKMRDLRLTVIRQAHTDLVNRDNDVEDSGQFTQAGAEQVFFFAEDSLSVMMESRNKSGKVPASLLQQLDRDTIDLVMVDGFGQLSFPRIEIHRPSTGCKPMFPVDNSIIAVTADEYLETGGLPLLDINLPAEIAGYINRWLRSHPSAHL